jgi:hypothetical protein
MQNINFCSKERIDLIKQNVANYKSLYTKYLSDKKEIDIQKENIYKLIDDKKVELENNLIIKNTEMFEMACDPENNFKDCYLKCKKTYNPNNRKPDVFVTTECKDNNDGNKASCVCYYPDYNKIDSSIDDINNLLKKKLNLLEIQGKLVKPEDIVYKDPCCVSEIVCKDGECSDIDVLCKGGSNVVESFTTHNNNNNNINHILMIVIIILIVFFLCK